MMRILLDESLPRDLSELILEQEVTTVRAAGWSGLGNGELPALAATRFDVFVAADRNIEYQQNLATRPIAIVDLILRSRKVDLGRRNANTPPPDRSGAAALRGQCVIRTATPDGFQQTVRPATPGGFKTNGSS